MARIVTRRAIKYQNINLVLVFTTQQLGKLDRMNKFKRDAYFMVISSFRMHKVKYSSWTWKWNTSTCGNNHKANFRIIHHHVHQSVSCLGISFEERLASLFISRDNKIKIPEISREIGEIWTTINTSIYLWKDWTKHVQHKQITT